MTVRLRMMRFLQAYDGCDQRGVFGLIYRLVAKVMR